MWDWVKKKKKHYGKIQNTKSRLCRTCFEKRQIITPSDNRKTKGEKGAFDGLTDCQRARSNTYLIEKAKDKWLWKSMTINAWLVDIYHIHTGYCFMDNHLLQDQHTMHRCVSLCLACAMLGLPESDRGIKLYIRLCRLEGAILSLVCRLGWWWIRPCSLSHTHTQRFRWSLEFKQNIIISSVCP